MVWNVLQKMRELNIEIPVILSTGSLSMEENLDFTQMGIIKYFN